MRLLLGYLIIISIVSVIVCSYDKIQAIRRGRRISERTLIFLSIIGGSIAMYLSMFLIHHKTKHMKFMIGLPLEIALHAAIICAILYLKFN